MLYLYIKESFIIAVIGSSLIKLLNWFARAKDAFIIINYLYYVLLIPILQRTIFYAKINNKTKCIIFI